MLYHIFFCLGIYYSNYDYIICILFWTYQNDKGNYLDKLCFYNYSVVKINSGNYNNIYIYIYIYNTINSILVIFFHSYVTPSL